MKVAGLKITVIDGDVSYPPNSGKRLRTLKLLLPLAGRHTITYLARSESPPESPANREAAAYFRDHGIEPILVNAPLPPKRDRLRFAANLARNLLSPLPYSVATHASRAMRDAARAHAARRPVDLWQLEWSGYGYCVEGASAPVVLQAHNVDALLWRRYGEAERNPVRRAFIADQERKFISFERRAFQAADRIVAVSEEDSRNARQMYGPLPIDVVDNGVDVAGLAGVTPEIGCARILFLGALDWRPNIDGIDFLLRDIWPAVRSARPGARLVVVGRNPPADLARRLAATEGTELHADVPDVKPFLASCATMAVPLRIGGGSRLKVLEAMAAGLPVVSTGIGAEGLGVENGVHFRRADTAPDFAAALVAALTSPDAQAQMARRARAWVSVRHDWSLLSARLEESWLRTVAARGDVKTPS